MLFIRYNFVTKVSLTYNTSLYLYDKLGSIGKLGNNLIGNNLISFSFRVSVEDIYKTCYLFQWKVIISSNLSRAMPGEHLARCLTCRKYWDAAVDRPKFSLKKFNDFIYKYWTSLRYFIYHWILPVCHVNDCCHIVL